MQNVFCTKINLNRGGIGQSKTAAERSLAPNSVGLINHAGLAYHSAIFFTIGIESFSLLCQHGIRCASMRFAYFRTVHCSMYSVQLLCTYWYRDSEQVPGLLWFPSVGPACVSMQGAQAWQHTFETETEHHEYIDSMKIYYLWVDDCMCDVYWCILHTLACTHACTHARLQKRKHTRVLVCMRVHVCACVCVCASVYLCVYMLCECVCTCIPMSACGHVCVLSRHTSNCI